jgi:hypothetical protein
VNEYCTGLDDVDDQVRNQLVASIGKTITPQDFAAYMKFHNQRLLNTDFQIQPFSHPIRRSAAHSPEGSISINEVTNVFILQPIHTFKNTVPTPSTMTFALSSSSKVTIAGKRYLHMYLSHAFSNEMLPTTLTLTAQTKKFSSFLLVIGRVVSSSEFDATYATII